MIRLEHVSKNYGKDKAITQALKDVSVDINDGEMVAIMGTSGSGKSTMLNIIGMMDNVTSGKYILNGEDVCALKPGKKDELRNNNISFIFQNFALLEDYSVYENVELPLVNGRVPRKERKKVVLDALKKMGIEKLEKKYPSKISGGQQQRCAIARALVSGNNIILADEPTGALDSTTSKEIMQEFKKLNDEGKTIIIVTHDINVANECERIINISDGRIV